MESKVIALGASTPNNLIAWAMKFSLPQQIIEIFQANGLNTLEDVGRTWASNYHLIGKLLKGETKTKEVKDKLEIALQDAENFYHQMEKKRILNDEDSDYEKVDRKQAFDLDVEAAPKSNSSPREVVDLDKLKIANNTSSRENSRETKVETEAVPGSLSRQSSIGIVDENASFLPDFQDWITKSSIPAEITDEFLKNNILSLETLANASDKFLTECSEKVKPIPRKKFMNAVKDLRTNLGINVASSAPAGPSPAPLQSVPIAPVPAQYQEPYLSQMTSPPVAPIPEPLDATEEDVIMGEIILMSTESTKSIEELRKQLEHENNTIETLIQLTVNSKEKFSDKALEIINQSKLDHQERAKRIKKLIQAKRAMEGEAGIPGTQFGPNKVNNLVRSTSTTSEPGVPIITSGDSFKKLTFTSAVNTHLITKDSHWKDSKKYPSVERLKPKEEIYAKAAIDPGAMTVRRPTDGVSTPTSTIPAKPQADPSKPTWTCSICKRVNGMELNKCPDCFSDRYGKSSVGEKYHSRYDGYGYVASTSSSYAATAASAAAPPPASSYSAPHPKSKPDVYGGGYNLCKKCRRLTDKRFFCINCVAEHERKIGHEFDGECSNCRDCGEITLNEDFCDDCGLIRAQAKITAAKQQYYTVGGGGGTKSKIKHCGHCHKQIGANISYCPHCLRYQP